MEPDRKPLKDIGGRHLNDDQALTGRDSYAVFELISADYLLLLLSRFAAWRPLGRVLSPFWRILSIYWYIGSATHKGLAILRQLLVRLIGHLYAPCTADALRRFGYRLWVVRRWHVAATALMGIGIAHGLAQQLLQMRSPAHRERRRLLRAMRSASTYKEWSEAATCLDELERSMMSGCKLEEARRQELRLYDAGLLEQHRRQLQQVRADGDVHQMMFALRADLLRNLGNMANSRLHKHCPVVPAPITRYIDEVAECLEAIAGHDGPDLKPDEKLAFLRETRHTFGRTALVLSGGGSLGAFHLGTVKALLEHGLLPRVLAGSSVGSIISSLIATRTDEELRHLFDNMGSLDLSFFNNNSPGQLFAHLVTKGSLQDVGVLQHRLKGLIGDLTFQEAYERTGRILNVCVCAADTNEPPRLLNYLTAPHALIWSAVAASSAFPLLFHPAELLARNSKGELVPYMGNMGIASHEEGGQRQRSRRWLDGSLEQDLPMRGLSEMFNVNYFLVSQANPHVVPILYLKSKVNTAVAEVVESEWKHRCSQLQALLPADCFPYKLLTLVSQTWEGDVTVVLPLEHCHIGKAIVNPTRDGLLDAIRAGERQTWAKLAAIQCNCCVEATLDRCLNEAAAAERQRRAEHSALGAALQCQPASARLATLGSLYTRRMMGRIPSWLVLSAASGEPAKPCEGRTPDSAADRSAAPQQASGSAEAADSEADQPEPDHGTPGAGADDPLLGLPCGAPVLMPELPRQSPARPKGLPFGSQEDAEEFWSRLFPVACATQLEGRDIEALDLIAP
eukprot:CAMPEP_0177585320 /NCGR_PEP_ID=MMETSP0419_2-20121207/4418_1 /TAXON_ID=582737 /ORGANISM="Tetraselmis sp., Strain GSL018" /LENGTH=792 /DNA_ID=CAMNT_0019075021 /DNA_START=442 /DNA_END=2820 /DNA_ORIENTATION=+